MLSLTVDRESVCMGDDVDCHQKTLQIQSLADTVTFIKEVLKHFYIPKMENCLWGVWLNDSCIAKIECDTGQVFPFNNELTFLTENKVYFSYHYPNGRDLDVSP